MNEATSEPRLSASAPATGTATPEEIRAAIDTGLYANAEHEACGVGFVAHIKGSFAGGGGILR